MDDERRYIGEPFLSPGGGLRLLRLIAVIGLSYLVMSTLHKAARPRHGPTLAPPHIREQAAICVLYDDPRACAVAWGWSPSE
jgi:hypothetical protein